MLGCSFATQSLSAAAKMSKPDRPASRWRAAAGVTRTLSITETRLRYGREAISRSNQPALNSYTLALAAPRNRDPPDSAQRGILVNLREVSGRHPGGPDPSMAQGPRRDGHLSGIRFPRQECLVALSAD